MDIYLTASQFGKYPGLATDTEVNNCYIYLSGFVKTWLKKFQVHFNYLTSKWNGKQLKVTS